MSEEQVIKSSSSLVTQFTHSALCDRLPSAAIKRHPDILCIQKNHILCTVYSIYSIALYYPEAQLTVTSLAGKSADISTHTHSQECVLWVSRLYIDSTFNAQLMWLVLIRLSWRNRYLKDWNRVLMTSWIMLRVAKRARDGSHGQHDVTNESLNQCFHCYCEWFISEHHSKDEKWLIWASDVLKMN